LLHDAQVPFSVADEPFRYSPALQLPWSTHSNPSVVPLHDPVVYCEEPHLVFEQDVHVPLAVEDAPLRKRPLPHEGWSLQSPLAVTECPLRNWLLWHVGWSAHLNPSLVPLHVPVRNRDELEPQSALEHEVQVPFAVVDEPLRNCSAGQDGCALHSNPSVVPTHDPVLYCEEPHWAFEHDVQAPLAVGDDPFRNKPDEHVGWSAHLKLLVVPAQEPVRYCEEPQLVLEQVEHWYPLLVPEHEPCLYWPTEQRVPEVVAG